MTKVYIAGPFFSEDQSKEIEELESMATLDLEVFSPRQSKASRLYNQVQGDVLKRAIFIHNIKEIDNSDFLVCNLNGLDSGTLFEIGYAYGKDKKILNAFDKYREQWVPIYKFLRVLNLIDTSKTFVVGFDKDGMMRMDYRNDMETFIIAESQTYHGLSKVLLGFSYSKNVPWTYIDVPRKSNIMLTMSGEVRESSLLPVVTGLESYDSIINCINNSVPLSINNDE